MYTHHAAIGRLHPHRRDEYLALHRAVPPEVEALIAQAGISEYHVYEHDGLLFSTYRHHGADHAADLQRMINHPVMVAWWARCVPCFDCADPRAPWHPLTPAWIQRSHT